MVSKIVRLETTVVNSEYDALLLENNLIKRTSTVLQCDVERRQNLSLDLHQKRKFSTNFFDQKSSKMAANITDLYAKVRPAKILLETIKNLYKIRSCNLDLAPKKIEDGKYKVCLEYHIKNCKGPCEGLESLESYDEKIDAIRGIIKGDFRKARKYLEDEMFRFAANLEFEAAQNVKKD